MTLADLHTVHYGSDLSVFDLRASMALDIARWVSAGQRIPEWVPESFAELDLMCERAEELQAGAAFGVAPWHLS